MNSKSVITTTVGYMCLGLTGWMVSMPNAAWFQQHVYGHAMALLLPLAVILGVMGILAFIHENALDSIIFFGAAALLWSTHASEMTPMVSGGSYAGWYFLVWAVFFCYVWLSAFRAGWSHVLFLLGLWLTLLSLAIGSWFGVHAFVIIGGYLGLATSILALIVSAEKILHTSAPARAS